LGRMVGEQAERLDVKGERGRVRAAHNAAVC
jgi:hypothetical protein